MPLKAKPLPWWSSTRSNTTVTRPPFRQLTRTQNLGFWKAIVLPYFLQNLQYIQSETDIIKMQTSLNLSLARVLHVYGDHTGLLADAGIPPLQSTKYVDLDQLHFRLTITRPDTLPALLFNKTRPFPSATFTPQPWIITYDTQPTLSR